MATFAPVRTSFHPPIPQTFEDLGIPENLVLDLVLRRMSLEGFCSLATLSQSLRVSVPVVDTIFKHMRQQQLVEIKGMLGNDYNFVLSQAGKNLARVLLRPGTTTSRHSMRAARRRNSTP